MTSLKPSIVAYLVKPFAQKRVVEAVSRAVTWHGAAVARALEPKPDANRVSNWLDSIDD